jgi:hypothetical protein
MTAPEASVIISTAGTDRLCSAAMFDPGFKRPYGGFFPSVPGTAPGIEKAALDLGVAFLIPPAAMAACGDRSERAPPGPFAVEPRLFGAARHWGETR